MKSKILLTMILSSVGFAVYFFFSNLKKAQNEVYYSVTAVNNQQNAPLLKNSALSKSKRKHNNIDNANFSSDAPVVPLNNNSSTLISGNSEVSNINNNLNVGTVALQKRSKTGTANSLEISGIMMTQASSIKQSNKSTTTLLITNSSYSIANKNSLNAPIFPSTTDDIIIDPGGDPDPESMIPVGNGNFISILLILTYFIYNFYRRNIKKQFQIKSELFFHNVGFVS